jgi:capsular polysaccharide biosynthesis protein
VSHSPIATETHTVTDEPRGLGRSTGPGWRGQIALVVCVTIAAGIAGGAYVAKRPVQYRSTANIFVAPLSLNDPISQGLPFIRESSDGSRPVQSAVGIVGAPAVARAAAETLGGGWTESRVARAVAVTPRGESDLVAVSATESNGKLAAHVANVYAREALNVRREAIAPYVRNGIQRLKATIQVSENQTGAAQATDEDTLSRLNAILVQGDPTLSIASAALPPTASTAKSARLVIAIALLVGFLVGIGLAFFRSATAQSSRY